MRSTKNESPTLLASPSDPKVQSKLKVWILAARPKTLIAGISPVFIGAACANIFSPLLLLLCLSFSIVLQIGTNWANDYFDYCKGADTETRKGPQRAVQAGWITPLAMRNAFIAAFSLAALLSLPLLWRIGFSYLPLMLLCIACGVLYTGSKRPLGYLGLGEALVLVFYGPVAVCCTALVLTHFISVNILIASLAPGFLSCAILCINNLRDAAEDRKAGKMTLIARFGQRFGEWEYVLSLLVAALVPLLLILRGMPLSLFATWALLPLAREPLSIVFYRKEELNRALALTARLLALYTILFCLALCVSL